MLYNDIADYFIAFANSVGDSITPLKLQKLVFYAQAWHLAEFDEALFEQDFQAWVHGPVLPELYEKYQDFKWYPIRRDDLDEEAFEQIQKKLATKKEFLEKIMDTYFRLTAYELEIATHQEEPWQKARLGLKPDESSQNSIQKDWLKNYYGKKLSNS